MSFDAELVMCTSCSSIVEMFLSRKSALKTLMSEWKSALCTSIPFSPSSSANVMKYPGYNQVILSKGKTKANSSAQFYLIAQEFGKLMIQNPQIPRFDLLKDVKDPTSFLFMEVYNGPGIFQQHVQSQEFDQFQVVAEPLLEDEFELEEFQTIYPLQVSIFSPPFPLP
jgi:quinol monooxygenase YgiN